MASAICSAAYGRALAMNAPKESETPCLCMIVTATRVEAEPMGVRLPPRFAPKITDHHSGESGAVSKPGEERIFASIAASGILSVTLLATAATTCGPWVYAWATGNASGVEIATSGAACLAFLTNAAAACGLIFNG